MKVEDAIFNRRSVRKFKNTPVEQDKISQIIEAAIYAPSASNKQAWKFIVVDDLSLKEEICKMNGSVVKVGSDIIRNAPSGILVLYRNDVSKNYKMYKDTIQSAAAAIENMLLMAYNLGLGACWVCKLPLQKKMRELFQIPKRYDIIAYIILGYPEEGVDTHTLRHFKGQEDLAKKRPRKYSVEDVMSFNVYKSGNECNETYKFVRLVCLLQEIQLSMKKGTEGMGYKILRRVLELLGEKWT